MRSWRRRSGRCCRRVRSLGEGHRKVKVRLAAKGIRAGKNRVLRLMRAHGLLAPVRRGHPRGDRSHSGRIRTERPDEIWGTDASRFWTRAEGWCWFFGAVDHCASDVVGWARGERRRATAGRRWSRYARVSGPTWAASARPSPWASACGTTGARSTGRGSSRPRSKWLGIRSTPAYVGDACCIAKHGHCPYRWTMPNAFRRNALDSRTNSCHRAARPPCASYGTTRFRSGARTVTLCPMDKGFYAA